jgi:5-methylcytosine-specific restriction endonuclease McrA
MEATSLGKPKLEALESELAQQQAHMNAAAARWLGLLAEVDRRGDLAGDPLERWVAWRFGLSYREAAELVRVARALVELPVIRAAFERGELTYTKVRALTRVATPACEARLLRLGSVLTAPQLDRALRVYQRVTAAQAHRQHEYEYVSYYWDDDGTLFLQARLASEDGTLLVKALDAARERIRDQRRKQPPTKTPQPPAWQAPRPFEPDRSDKVEALLELAHQSLNPEAKESRRERPHLVVHVDAAKLTTDAATPGRCELDHGPVIAPETARRLGCDATTTTITETKQLPPSIGRKRRTIPPKLRRALEARDDGTCQWPGCSNTRYLDAHHRRHWIHGGETSLDNLILLCWHHHRHLHEGGYTIHPDPEHGIRFHNRYGIPVPTTPRSPPGNPDTLADQNKKAGLTITDTTNKNGTDEHPDPDQTNDALTSILG